MLCKDRVPLTVNDLGHDANAVDEEEQVDFDFDLGAPCVAIQTPLLFHAIGVFNWTLL